MSLVLIGLCGIDWYAKCLEPLTNKNALQQTTKIVTGTSTDHITLKTRKASTLKSAEALVLYGAPRKIRTPDLLIRRQLAPWCYGSRNLLKYCVFSLVYTNSLLALNHA